MPREVKAERRFTKSEVVFFRTSPEFKEQVIARSQLLGKSISEYLRDLVKEDLLNR